jgi:hypothetical protein
MMRYPGRPRLSWSIATLFLCLLAAPVHAQTQTQTQELIHQPDIQRAIKTIWAQTANGTAGIEAAFTINGTVNNYTIEMTKSDGQIGQNHVVVYSDTIAIFHVHPNFGSPKLSTTRDHYGKESHGDTWIADKHQLDIYAVSKYAIWVYYWQTKQMVKLVDDWVDKKTY